MHYATRLLMILVIAGAQASISGAPGLQAPPALARTDNRLTTLSGFTVDYPKRDWQLLVGTGSSVVVFFHRSREATVAIERSRVRNALAPNEIVEQTATLEVEDWGQRRWMSTGFTHQLVDLGGERTIVIDFTQPGPQGAEQVRIYTLPRGLDWYRVICTARREVFDKYKETCHRIALSLYPAPS
jgi:hypothetical protein